jgi:hypothetical protein
MKKMCLVSVFLVLVGFLAFSDTEKEIDFLLFALNSSSQFINDERAATQLDDLAKYLLDRNLLPGQIHVYGYAASAINDIDSIELSRDRALFVINELQKRGVPNDLFSEPVAYGAVDLWGSNINEEDKIQNRRVRVLVDDNIPALSEVEPEPIIIEYEDAAEESGSTFPWKIVLLLLIILAMLAAILFLLLAKKRKKPLEKTAEPQKVEEPVAPPAITSETVVNLEEEIRYCAYYLHLARNDWNGNVEEDWHRAVAEISARFQADGYQVYSTDGTWWARKSFTQ